MITNHLRKDREGRVALRAQNGLSPSVLVSPLPLIVYSPSTNYENARVD